MVLYRGASCSSVDLLEIEIFGGEEIFGGDIDKFGDEKL